MSESNTSSNPKSKIQNPKSVSIVIPTWNGRHLLEAFLPSVRMAADVYSRHEGAEVEIIIVDDGSTDRTMEWLQANFPDVIALRKETNEGFGLTCNRGFERAKFPVTLLLNNDVRVEADLLLHLTPHFSDQTVFAVCCKALEATSGVVATAGKIGEFKHGFWRVHGNYDIIESHPEPQIQNPESRIQNLSILASGGFSAFCTEKLRQLEGFNPLLAPFYWEDVDLSLRAWKRGWKILYEPRAIVYHATSSTIGSQFERPQIERIAQRNRLITHWINLHNRAWVVEHIGVVILLLLASILTLNFTFWSAFFGAVRDWPAIRRRRRLERQVNQMSDRELANLLTKMLRRPEVRLLHDS